MIEKQHNRRIRRGTTIVEAALVLPLLLTLTFAGIEYGWMMLCDQQLANVAEQATRAAATPTATNATVTSEVTTLMGAASMGSSGYTVTFNPTNVATVTKGNSVTVTISVPYKNVEVTGVTLFPLPATISSSSTVIKEGV
jgi:Flp pilus assembly protein TadG